MWVISPRANLYTDLSRKIGHRDTPSPDTPPPLSHAFLTLPHPVSLALSSLTPSSSLCLPHFASLNPSPSFRLHHSLLLLILLRPALSFSLHLLFPFHLSPFRLYLRHSCFVEADGGACGREGEENVPGREERGRKESGCLCGKRAMKVGRENAVRPESERRKEGMREWRSDRELQGWGRKPQRDYYKLNSYIIAMTLKESGTKRKKRKEKKSIKERTLKYK